MSTDDVPSTEPRVHEKYNDETAKIQLLSSDGVLFRVHDFHLYSNNSVFRDMREIRQAAGSEPQASSDEPIAMDCTAASLEVLLFFMLDPSTVLKTKPELAAIEGVLLLRERFEFKVVETRMKLFFKNSVEDRPWTSLALSFRWRDVAMAREAIPHLRMAHGKPPGPVNPEFFHALMKIWYDMDWQSYSSTVMAIASRFSFQD